MIPKGIIKIKILSSKKELIIYSTRAADKPPSIVPIILDIPIFTESTIVFCTQITAAMQANKALPLLTASKNKRHKKTEIAVLILRIPIFITFILRIFNELIGIIHIVNNIYEFVQK